MRNLKHAQLDRVATAMAEEVRKLRAALDDPRFAQIRTELDDADAIRSGDDHQERRRREPRDRVGRGALPSRVLVR